VARIICSNRLVYANTFTYSLQILICILDKEINLFVRGVDLVNQTPILDIKPYVPYADAVEARSPFHEAPEFKKVIWMCREVNEKALIEKVIALDPRPAYEKDKEGEFGVTLAGYNVRFKALITHFEIISATAQK
jgi:hypothetical protein